MLIKGLKVVEAQDTSSLPENLRARSTFIAKLDEQIALCAALIEGKTFQRDIKKRQVTDGQKSTVTVHKDVKPWWKKNVHGVYLMDLRSGSAKVKLDGDKTTIECGKELADVTKALTMVSAATQKGDLDKALLANRKARGGKKKAAK